MPRTAIVVGAGLGGLATAIALRRSGWTVTVLEAASQVGEVGGHATTRSLDRHHRPPRPPYLTHIYMSAPLLFRRRNSNPA